MSDRLLRESDVINLICKLKKTVTKYKDLSYHDGLFDVLEGIQDLPSADRLQGEWVKKPHTVYLPRDYEPDINDYRDRQYNEKDHSIVQYWWHCSQCNFEADRWFKPTFNLCPCCGARMKGVDDEY